MKRAAYIVLLIIALAGGQSLAAGQDYTIQGSLSGDVYFDTLSDELTGQARTKLDELAAWLLKNPGATVLLAGYDDDRTPGERSIELGWERVGAVRDYLVQNGADEDRIHGISFGNTKGIQTGTGEAVWAKERRVRYRVVPRTDDQKMEGRPAGVCQKCKK